MKIIKYADAQSVMAQIAEALARGETFTVEPKKPEKWKPKRDYSCGSYWTIKTEGEVSQITDNGGIFSTDCHKFGNYFLRKDHADKARDPDRLRNIFRLFVLEHAPDFDVYGPGWSVFFDAGNSCRVHFPGKYIGMISTPKEVAQKFCDLYNAGLIDMGDE